VNLLDRFKTGLTRTRQQTLGKLTGMLTPGKIDAEVLDELETALIEADVGVNSVEELVDKLRSGRSTHSGLDPAALLKSELISLLDDCQPERPERFTAKPWVILLAGVNGSGKTTTAGKLAHYFSLQGKRSVVAAADTFRAAAVEQIEEWARRGGARIIKQSSGADPAAVAFDAYQSARARGEDLLLVDTAGRLQARRNLMDELAKIGRVLKQLDPSAPHEALLVMDATTGQNGLSQASGFTAAVGVTGLIVTKLDGTARGGVVVPIRRELGLPIEFIGMGEGRDDLHPFDAKTFVDALLDI